jgi:hypothetical protein
VNWAWIGVGVAVGAEDLKVLLVGVIKSCRDANGLNTDGVWEGEVSDDEEGGD